MPDPFYITVVIADVVATVVGVGIIAFALVRVLERGQRTMMQIALQEQRKHYEDELKKRDTEINRLKSEVATLERLLSAKFPKEMGVLGE